jgi:hypothetical protein
MNRQNWVNHLDRMTAKLYRNSIKKDAEPEEDVGNAGKST